MNKLNQMYRIHFITQWTLGSFLMILMSLCLFVDQSYGGPWLIQPGKLEVGVGTNFGYARSEFINDRQGTYQVFPFGGELRIYGFKLDLRYGLKKKLELTFSTQFQSLIYSAQSVVDQDRLRADPDAPIPLLSLDSSLSLACNQLYLLIFLLT